MPAEQHIKVMFVCMGNICRSPTAHGVFQAMVNEQGLSDFIEVESSGTHSYHIGNQPDPRSQATALKNGVDLSGLSARRFIEQDFHDFDYILAMDNSNLRDMLSIQPSQHSATVSLMLDYSEKYSQKEVPDPYFGDDGFDLAFDMVDDASAGLLRFIRQKHSM